MTWSGVIPRKGIEDDRGTVEVAVQFVSVLEVSPDRPRISDRAISYDNPSGTTA